MKRKGLVLVELLIIVVIIFLLAAIMFPLFAKAGLGLWDVVGIILLVVLLGGAVIFNAWRPDRWEMEN